VNIFFFSPDVSFRRPSGGPEYPRCGWGPDTAGLKAVDHVVLKEEDYHSTVLLYFVGGAYVGIAIGGLI
jgi:hypothetical protein